MILQEQLGSLRCRRSDLVSLPVVVVLTRPYSVLPATCTAQTCLREKANRHSVVTAHTGLANATMFDKLTSVRKGDYFYIEVQGEPLKYRVVDIYGLRPE
ncbi:MULTISPECIES: sortase [Winkia]|uniref:sortase n=1 Tax=Winkia TaxID=2692118 RepID=UPI0009DA39A7|nr:sortase [Winkia neuii]NJJ14825.1 sortase [Winkia neuii]PLB81246.1 sortase [Actinomyces sp. UMB0138]PMC93349.1 sortase [Actinomyces sp. UMB0918]